MNKAAKHVDSLPPEQEVASSNLAGRTIFQSVTAPTSARPSDLPADSVHNPSHSAHQLTTERNRCRSEQLRCLSELHDSSAQLGISDWFGEEILIERERAALEASR